MTLLLNGRPEDRTLSVNGRPEDRTLSVNGRPEGPVQGGSTGGHKVKVRQEYPDHCSEVEARRRTLSMKGRQTVQDIAEGATVSEEETRTGHSHESCSAVSDTRYCQ
jgi:hypothetical protein